MTSTFTTNKGYQLQGTGDNPNTWGATLNTNVFTIVDNNLGSLLTLSVAGNSNVTLTSTQAQNFSYKFTGALTGNIQVLWPSGAGGFFQVTNATSGAFTLTLKNTGGAATTVVPQGSKKFVFTDGTNFFPCTIDDGFMTSGVDAGSASAFSVTTNDSITAYFTGLKVKFPAANANAAGATLTVDTVGAKPLYVPGTTAPVAIPSSYFTTAQWIEATYDTALNSGSGGWHVLVSNGGLGSLAQIQAYAFS